MIATSNTEQSRQLTEPTAVKATARRLLTELPGPRSRELEAERRQHVTDAFGITLPVFIERAMHSVLVDVDGNHLIDFASGIGVTGVGAANPLVAKRAG